MLFIGNAVEVLVEILIVVSVLCVSVVVSDEVVVVDDDGVMFVFSVTLVVGFRVRVVIFDELSLAEFVVAEAVVFTSF